MDSISNRKSLDYVRKFSMINPDGSKVFLLFFHQLNCVSVFLRADLIMFPLFIFRSQEMKGAGKKPRRGRLNYTIARLDRAMPNLFAKPSVMELWILEIPDFCLNPRKILNF
jgi:hypothetical protein